MIRLPFHRLAGSCLLAMLLTASFLFGLIINPLQAYPPEDSSEVSAEFPLFASQEFLTLRLETDLRKLIKDKKDKRDYHPGVLVYAVDSGEVRIPVQLRIRGNFRRTTCGFPPIRLKFDSADVVGTLFQGQRKLKLVTHCQKQTTYESYVREEYLLYRVYNQVTTRSFNARFGEITYVDTRGKMDTLVKPTFLIEPVEQVGIRNEARLLEVKHVHPNETDQYQATLAAFFAYMVGNTDWSIPGLHNVKLFRTQPGVPPFCVPYDFDWSGALSTPYATPDAQLGATSVKDRVFRGFCVDQKIFEAVVDTFQAQRESIMNLYLNMPGIPQKRLDRVLKYYKSFYAILDDPVRLKKEILDKCRTDR